MLKSIYKPIKLAHSLQPILFILATIAIIMPQTFNSAIEFLLPFLKILPLGFKEIILCHKILTPLYLGADHFDNILPFKNKSIVPTLYGLWNCLTYLLLYLLAINFNTVFQMIWQLKENLLESGILLIGFVVFLNDKVAIFKSLYRNSRNPHKRKLLITSSIVGLVLYLVKI